MSRAWINPTGERAEGCLQFGGVTADWTLSTRSGDLPPGAHSGAARSIALDSEVVCDFSDYSALHTVLYQEVFEGHGPRIEDATAATGLAERIRDAATHQLLAATPA